MSDAASTTAREPSEKRGPVLEVLGELLTERRDGEVLALVSKLVARNSELERRLMQLLSRGHKNEGVSAAQLRLFLDALAATGVDASDDGAPDLGDANAKLRGASGIDDAAETAAEKPAKQPPLRKPPSAKLPRVDNPIAVPPAERACPTCGTERACIGHDVTEVIELEPARVVVRVDRREKLACGTCEGELVRAPVGDKVVSGGRLGSTLVAALVVDKYDDGLPLHRQKRRFERMGVDLAVSTLADQVTWATDLMRPLWRTAIEQVLAATVMHLDATGLPVLDRDAVAGKRLGALWGYVGDENVAAYLYASTAKKSAQRPGELGPEEMLARRAGYTVADASNLFDQSFERPDLIECGCNMHGRRYWTKALDAGDSRAALPIAAYKKLYEIEAKIRGLAPDDKRVVRQAESKPVFDEIVSWAEAYKPHEPPKSGLGTAIRYMTNHKVALGRFLDDGVIPIDNGIVERLHVRAALTRKNYLFAGSDTGGERAAIAYTILACCRLVGLNPVEYLTDVLPRLARGLRLRDVPAMLPAAWKLRRQVAVPCDDPVAAPVS
ncbi:MAG: IS66 family transposase [Chloroflexota bacterium]|nr:IS66 family transposase [Chloroflexota bacterium]